MKGIMVVSEIGGTLFRGPSPKGILLFGGGLPQTLTLNPKP